MAKKNTKGTLKTNVLNKNGKVSGKISLPEEIFATAINEKLLAQAVYIYQDRTHPGNTIRKTRADVSGSGRKIYRQKGTGRARHGDRQAPIFVGGGVAHGPKRKGKRLALSKKLRRQAILFSLRAKFDQKKLTIIDNLDNLRIKTKKLVDVLTKAGINVAKEKVLLALPKPMENVFLAGRNIPYLTIKPVNLLNAYDVLRHQQLVLLKESLLVLKKNFKDAKNNRKKGDKKT